MRKITRGLFSVFSILVVHSTSAQVTVSGGTGAAGVYTTLQAAVSAINGFAVTGPVTVDIIAGHTETITATISLTATGTAANPIVFQKSGAGNNPLITAYTGGTVNQTSINAPLDGIFRLVGSDYVTIHSIDIQENPVNSGLALMEYGFAFFKDGFYNGCQNNTIQNCTITLNRANTVAGSVGEADNGPCGIWVSSTPFTGNSLQPILDRSGTHSNNRIYSNTIQNCNTGIYLRGYASPDPYDYYDNNNDVGGSSPATGNTIINYGGAGVSASAYGIRGIYQDSFNISYNIIQNNNGGGFNHTSSLWGIFMGNSFKAKGTFNHNTITLAGGGTTTAMTAIENQAGNNQGSNSIVINNNTIQNCTYSTATGANFTGILNIGAASTIQVHNNNVSNNSLPGTGVFTAINAFGSSSLNLPTISVNNNTVTNNTKTGASGPMYCIRSGSSSLTINGNSLHDNSITANSGSASSNLYGIFSDDAPSSESINNNTIHDLTISGSSTATTTLLYGIFSNTDASITSKTISGNLVYNLQYSNSSSGAVTIAGIYQAFSSTCNLHKNKIYGLTANNGENSLVYGIYSGNTITLNMYNNLVGNLTNALANTDNAIQGININSSIEPSTNNVSFNTVWLDASSGGTNFGTTGIIHTSQAVSTTATLNLRNNIIVNTSIPAGTGLTVAYRRTGTALDNYGTASNNNLYYAGTASATHLIFHDGTNSDQNLDQFKTRVAPRDAASVTENPPFISTTGANANFLHIDPAIFTQIESGAIPVTGINQDYDGNARNGTTPDIGADEFTGTNIDLNGPAISYSPVGNTCATGGRIISAIITDPSGVPIAGPGLPVVYWRINAGAYTAATGTPVGGGMYQFSIGAGSVNGNVISYYFVAQDNAGTPNIRCFPSAGAGGFSVNPPAAAIPPTTPFSYTISGSLSGTYTVGSGGTYPTLTAAIADYNTKCLGGPVILELINANYSGGETFPLTIASNPDASAVNTLTIRPAAGLAVTISGSSGVTPAALLRLNAARYVTIDGLNTGGASLLAENTSATPGTAVVWISSNGPGNGAHHNTIRNLSLKGGITQTNNAGTTYGVLVAGSSISDAPASVTGGEDNDNTLIEGNTFTKLRIGVYTRGGSPANPNTGTQVKNNIIGPSAFGTEVIGQTGILAREEDGIVITGNEIRYLGGNYTTATLGADRVGISFSTDGAFPAGPVYVKNALVAGNRIHDLVDERTFSALGISIAAADGSNATNNTVANNMLYAIRSNGAGGDKTIGIELAAGNGDKIVYNSIYLSGDTDPDPSATAPDESGFGLAITTMAVSNPLVRNNLVFMDLVSSSMSGLDHACISIPDPITWLWGTGNSDYNDFYVSGGNTQAHIGNTSGSGGSFYATLNGWQNAVIQDGNSISIAPVFESAGNLHLSTSANSGINNKGIPVPGVTTDFDGQARDGSVPDIGCDEFTPATVIVDMSATALVSPAASGCYSAAETVTITVTNQSLSAIDFAINNVTVSASASGAAVYASNTVLNSGTLAAGASMNVNMPATIDMSANGTYTFNASTAVTGDVNTGNDAMAPVNRVVSTVLAGIAGGPSVSKTLNVTGPSLFAEDITCNVIAKLIPGGSSPVNGNVTARVWVENTVPKHGSNPFVARHYEISAATNPATVTGTVILYFTQAEFNAFNADPASLLDLPTGPADAVGKANLKVIKYPGTSADGSGHPASYSGTPVLIDPADVHISWDAAGSRWEVRFDFTGLSGFTVGSSSTLNLCPGSGSFVVPAGAEGASYQWQVNGGGGFINISDGVNYSGTSTSILSMSGLPTSFTGYQYRCLVNGAPSPVTYQVKFVLEWQGAVDINWHNAQNWGGCGAIPDLYTEVIIPLSRPRYPTLASNGEARSLYAAPGTSVIVLTGSTLNIAGQ